MSISPSLSGGLKLCSLIRRLRMREVSVRSISELLRLSPHWDRRRAFTALQRVLPLGCFLPSMYAVGTPEATAYCEKSVRDSGLVQQSDTPQQILESTLCPQTQRRNGPITQGVPLRWAVSLGPVATGPTIC